jgi:hypothetical protein
MLRDELIRFAASCFQSKQPPFELGRGERNRTSFGSNVRVDDLAGSLHGANASRFRSVVMHRMS